jgi:general secretion pathway protein D
MNRHTFKKLRWMIAAGLVLSSAVSHAQEMPPPPPADFSAPASASADMPAGASTLGTELPGDVVIQYDPQTDSLIIITDEVTNEQIGRVIETLDKPIPQVLIKVLFLEVTYSNGLDLGVEGSFSYGSDPTKDSILTDFGVDNAVRGGFYRILDSDFTATLRALATAGKLEVLSRPSVLARNNETATITIGQEVPFIRNSRVTDNGQTINTVEYEDIGIILEVTPHITPDRMVEMEVYPEISTLTGDTVPISDTVDATVIAKRSAETRVAVADGKTVVIGGLMEDNETEAVQKIPILGDIPVLGFFFRRTISNKSKTELLIFLTPHVVLDGEELDDVTRQERSKNELAPQAFKDVHFDKYLDNLEPIIPAEP